MSMWFHEPHKPIATDIKFSELYPNESDKHKEYFSNISQVDYVLGELMKELDKKGLSDNTLIMFTSDNGPVTSVGGTSGGPNEWWENEPNPPMRGLTLNY
ncbi:MAG: sulfatase-like hydrolase/transferase [Aliiglaciecola sp.]|uniref:sulfatase-like hydrolase/transferase n=1 Tax=Aliiglaciecola sp. TaxID=1872441 RepID=UPI00329A72F5